MWCVGVISQRQCILCQALSATRGDHTLCHEYLFRPAAASLHLGTCTSYWALFIGRLCTAFLPTFLGDLTWVARFGLVILFLCLMTSVMCYVDVGYNQRKMLGVNCEILLKLGFDKWHVCLGWRCFVAHSSQLWQVRILVDTIFVGAKILQKESIESFWVCVRVYWGGGGVNVYSCSPYLLQERS